eukprot:TRINITY_DN6259_c0_g1_i1.p1 TRINITY_DN6259_c0_g1~~TRINITY_DN6259_c0_g1_i1.p1  ORF type:complete len:304 (+),score=83.01 TRINITY_DN6259_c0_g1_i1:377-1288(+)
MVRHAFKPPSRNAPTALELFEKHDLHLVPHELSFSTRLAFYIRVFDSSRVAAVDPAATVGVKRSRRSAYAGDEGKRRTDKESAAPCQLAGRGVETAIQQYIDEVICGWTPFDALWVHPETGVSRFVRVLTITPNKRRQHQRQSKPTSCRMIYANAAIIRVKYESEEEMAADGVAAASASAAASSGAFAPTDDDLRQYDIALDYGRDTAWSFGPTQKACIWDLYPTYHEHTDPSRASVSDPSDASPCLALASHYGTAIEHVRFFWDWLWDGADDTYLLSHHPFLPELQLRMTDAFSALGLPLGE